LDAYRREHGNVSQSPFPEISHARGAVASGEVADLRPLIALPPDLDRTGAARLAVLLRLKQAGYRFASVKPTSHRRILSKRGRGLAQDLVDVFGWNLPFRPRILDDELLGLMRAGEMLSTRRGDLVASVRVASLNDQLYLHSAFGAGKDAVFFGPDTTRFAHFIRQRMPGLKPGAVVLDVGAGSGAGGIFAATLSSPVDLYLSDINPLALEFAAINAAAAGVTPHLVQGEGIGRIGPCDLILANPPYVAGKGEPTYSGGGGKLGEGLSLQWAREGAQALTPGGAMLLYTGSPIIRGRDKLKSSLAEIVESAGCSLSYEELDPDVLPELLLGPAYWKVERIAAIGAVIRRPV